MNKNLLASRKFLLAAFGLSALIVCLSLACGRVKSYSAQEVYEIVAPSVFVIEFSNSYGIYGTEPITGGSGVAVTEDDVVTNAHILQEFPGLVRVRQGDKRWRAFVSYLDRQNDICVLKVPGLKAKPAKANSSIGFEVGDRVFAVGAPRGLERSLSDGLISGLRTIGDEDTQVIQMTAAVSPGSSGGGLFDVKANLIGITTACLEESQNLNFAIPITTLAEAIFKGKTEANRLLALAIAYSDAEMLDKAQETIERVLTLDPQIAEAWYLRYQFENQKQTEQLSEAFLEEAVRLKPSFAEAWFSLGSLHVTRGTLETTKWRSKAQEEFFRKNKTTDENILEVTKKFIEIKNYIPPGASYDLEKGKAMLETAIECSPENTYYLTQHANCCLVMKHYDDALASIQKALDLDPMNISAFNALSMCDNETSTIPETFSELRKDQEKSIEKNIRILESTPKTSLDCYLLAYVAATVVQNLKMMGQDSRAFQYEVQAQRLMDLAKTLEGKAKIQREKDQAEARSALDKMNMI
jgi:tetratricopeptide (TPR) repeat protein